MAYIKYPSDLYTSQQPKIIIPNAPMRKKRRRLFCRAVLKIPSVNSGGMVVIPNKIITIAPFSPFPAIVAVSKK